MSYTPYSTLSHTGPYSLPPHGHIVGALPSKRTSVSAGYLNSIPPKKPPRLFHSRDNMSLTSQNSQTSDLGEQQFKLSLPKPGTVDSYGTAVWSCLLFTCQNVVHDLYQSTLLSHVLEKYSISAMENCYKSIDIVDELI